MTLSNDERLEKMGITLPPPPAPVGIYKPFLMVGSLAYESGHGPILDDQTHIRMGCGIKKGVDFSTPSW